MSERQPIDLDDLQRVGVLVREKTGDNWLADMVEVAATEIARLREERRWITVGERLPEEGEQVLCASSCGNFYAQSVVVFYRNDVGVVVWEDNEGFIHRPTHWMKLPAPPKGGEVE